MSKLAEQVQQAYDGDGFTAAQQAFIDKVGEQDWSEGELKEAVLLLRSFPKEA